MATCTSHSAEETERLGEAWGQAAVGGWFIGLTGELGAGKTQLVKGIARGLGVTSRVHSPTFILVNEYEGGRLPLVHMDLFRMAGGTDILDAGLGEYIIRPQGVVVIEWVDRWLSPEEIAFLVKGSYRQVNIVELGDCSRSIQYEDFGA